MGVKETVVNGTQDLFLSFGAVGLFAMAFMESSFFPIPPDVVLIPLALQSPELALFYAAVTTTGSVMGAVFGYYMGKRGGRPLLNRFVSEHNIDRVENYYDEYGIGAVGIAGFTPVPYKVFTISAGAFRLDLKSFIAVSVVSRGARFFFEAVLVMVYGERIITFLHGPFGIITIIVGVAVAAGYILWKRYL